MIMIVTGSEAGINGNAATAPAYYGTMSAVDERRTEDDKICPSSYDLSEKST